MRDDGHIPGYRVVIVTLDAHAAGPAKRISSASFVTPGIKCTTTPAGEDQKRVLSPGRAVAAAAFGRPLTRSPSAPAPSENAS